MNHKPAYEKLERRLRELESELARRQAEEHQKDRTERTRRVQFELETEEKINTYIAELERKNNELREFVSVASHDLQEPLRKIQAFGKMLQNELPQEVPTSVKEHLSRMIGAAARMQKLIRALLAYSRVSNQARPFERIDLQQIAKTVVDDLHVPTDRLEPVIKIRGMPVIDGNPVLISQLFQNLISNALRYSADGRPPCINISGREPDPEGGARAGHCELRVADNGIGFDMQYADKIFLPFERLHGRSEYEGTGMGLAICRKIAQHHGGDITAQSRIGEGSTFIISLPVRQIDEKGR